MKGAIFFKIDDELEALLVEPHHSLGLLEGLLQYVPNKNSFYELIPLRECAHSRMMDYDASDFSGILETPPSKRDIEPINSLLSAYKAAAGIQSLLKITAKIFGIAFNSDNTEQQIGIRDALTSLQPIISNLKAYNPMAPETILPSLANTSAYLHDSEDDLLIQAVLTHYQFEMIHPFEKHNGVVGRVAIFTVLQKL